MVYEQCEHRESQWAAIESVAKKIGCPAHTLRNWIAKAEGKAGADDAASTPRVKELEREVRELKRANEILKLASAFFTKAELDHRLHNPDWAPARVA
jgi:transposase-like protein